MGISQEVIARLTTDGLLIGPKLEPLYEDWGKYSQYISRGGKPQRLDTHCHNKSTFQPLVIIHRREFTNPYIMKKLIGWNNMPLKNADIVQTTKAIIAVDMLDNSVLILGKNRYTQVTNSGGYELSAPDVL